jgi:RHS repeat-associated protein
MKKLSKLCKRAHVKPAVILPLLAVICSLVLLTLWYAGPNTAAAGAGPGQIQVPGERFQIVSKMFGRIRRTELPVSPGETEELAGILSSSDGAAQTILSSGPSEEQLREVLAATEEELEAYITRYPVSGWSLALRKELALRYQDAGRITRAMTFWSEAWDIASQAEGRENKVVADYALVYGARLMASLGRLEELLPIAVAHRDRVLSEPHLAQMWVRTREAIYGMRRSPGIAYRCGTYALNNVAKQVLGHGVGGILSVPSSTNGFTLAELSALSDAYNVGLVAAVREPGADFLIPAVVHWKQNHYAAILGEENGRFLVQDPTFGKRKWIESEVLEEESSGFFLIPSGHLLPPGWRLATAEEMLSVYGKGYFEEIPDDDDTCTPGGMGAKCAECPDESGPGGTGGDGSPCESGMPFWSVREPNINLEVSDIPMKYDAAIGPDFVLQLNWRQRKETWQGLSHFSQAWESDLLSYLTDDYGWRYGLIHHSTVKLYSGRGFVYEMHFAGGSTVSDQNTQSGTWAVRTADANGYIYKIEVYYRNGAKDTYETSGNTILKLTSRADATGQAMTFTYDEPITGFPRLTEVTTADGAEFTFNYTSVSDDYLITGVTGPGSPSARSVSFGYTSGKLTSITDAVGIVSTFTYNPTTQWITDIATPYGTSSFNHWYASDCITPAQLSCDGVDRSIVITEPAGTHQVYLFYDNPYRSGVHGIPNAMAGKVPTAFSSWQIPYDTHLEQPVIQTLDTIRDERNSHYWNRQQAALIPASLLTNLNALTNTHYLVSRTRHWLHEYGEMNRIRVLSWELPPAADGVNESQPVFYDYPGKEEWWDSAAVDYTTYTGTNDAPTVIAQQMLDGTMRYEQFERNALGMTTRRIERWVENGSVVKRTNEFTYATGTGLAHVDNLLKVEHRGPGGKLVYGRALHSTYPDQIGKETNAVGEITVFNYDVSRRLTTKQTHAGLLSTYTYNGTNKRLEKVVDSISGTPVRTNSYTWLNGYQRTHTDARDFTRTFDYDYLGRLTQVTYPDSPATTEIYEYSLPASTGFNTSGSALAILDLVTYTDRMGNKTRTLPNRNRQIEKVIEPSRTTTGSFGTEHTIDYCGCGSPTSIIRGSNTANSETTDIEYDYQGRIKRIELPNGTTTTNWYDGLGRLWLQEDALSQTTTLYDNLNRVIQRSNGAGIIEAFAYDEDDRVTVSTNSSGVVVSHVYDDLDRILTRTYPSGGVEQWYYTPGYSDATIYTNQIGNLTTWAYDPAQRRTNEVGVGVYTNSFAYSAANDLLVLLDGKTNRTMWLYDAEGRMQVKTNQSNAKILTNAYNANGELTARWTPAKLLTSYTYDKVGNLTFVNYPSGSDVTLAYNDLNRMTSMQDGYGTTAFTYTTAGDLLTENGPLTDDTITYNYHLSVPHLRTNLTLAHPSGGGTWSQTYLHDSAKRISSITSPAGTFAYTYSTGVAGATNASQLWKKLALFNGSSAYITNIFDSSARLTNTTLFNSSNSELNEHKYLYNLANQRTNHLRTGGGFVDYTYDPIGQLQSAFAFLAGGGGADPAETKGYKYDAAQNLNVRTNNGSTTTFAVNVKNELTGAGYDANGNATSLNSQTLVYDAENRLTQITGYNNSFRYEFAYDGFGRMRIRSTFAWNGMQWNFQSAIRYIYDGWTVIQERNYGGTPTVSYTRGPDLSGTLQGAGGIGGLLARSSGYSSGSWSAHNAYHADGGGSITAMVNTSQALSANYRYDAFGNLITSSGGMASLNTYRFSSKEWIPNADLYYYGYRFYSPNYQRWINQDPLGEEGGINLYAFVRNNSPNRIDPFGLEGCGMGPGSGNPQNLQPLAELTSMAEGRTAQEGARQALRRSALNKVKQDKLFGNGLKGSRKIDPKKLKEKLSRDELQELQQTAKDGMAKAAQQMKNPQGPKSAEAAKNAFETQMNRYNACRKALK